MKIIRKPVSAAKKVGLLLTACFFLLGAFLFEFYFPIPLCISRPVEYPCFMTTDAQGNTYLINDSKSEVLKIDQNQKICYRLSTESTGPGSFQEANELAVDAKGNLYLREVIWDVNGLQVESERIIKYDKHGLFNEVVYEKDYRKTGEKVASHRLFALSLTEKGITFIEKGSRGFDKLCLSKGQLTKDSHTLPIPVDFQNFTVSKDGCLVYAADKKGIIYKFTRNSQQIVYTPDPSSYHLPFHLACGYDGSLYFADIASNSIDKLGGSDNAQLWLSKAELEKNLNILPEGSILMGIDLSGSESSPVFNVVFNSAAGSYSASDKDMIMSGREYTLSAGLLLLKILQILMFFVGLSLILAILFLKIKHLAVQGKFIKWRFLLITMGSIIVTAFVVVPSVLKQFREIYIEAQVEQMEMAAQIAASTIPIGDLKQVVYPDDYGSPSQKNLQKFMETLVNKDFDYSSKMYCNIVKYENDRCYAVAYLDQSIGSFYPLDDYESSELKEIYTTGKSYVNNGKDDSSGSYIYVKCPIVNHTGVVQGVIEIGMVMYSLQEKIAGIFHNIIVKVSLLVIVAVFAVNEFAGFLNRRASRKNQVSKQGDFPLSYVQLTTLVCYTAFNLPSVFLPVFMESFYSASLPFDTAGSLSLTANFLMIGLASLICAPILRRLTYRYLIILGAGLCFCGDLMTALSQGYWTAFAGLILNGAGVGLLINSLSVSVAGSDENAQKEGFSIINSSSLSGVICGMVIGGVLSERFGQSKVFFFSSGLWGIMILIFLAAGKYTPSRVTQYPKKKGGMFRFLTAPRILGFILLIQVPYVVLNGFTNYFVPVFANENGLSESETSLLLVLFSLTGIFLSMAITNWIYKKYKRNTLYMSMILSLGAILIFSLHPTLPFLILCIFLLGVSQCFGLPVRNIYYCQQKEVQTYGEDRAMGIYNFTDNVADSAGSSIFGLISRTGLLPGTLILTGISMAFISIHALLTSSKFSRKRKEE